MSLVTYRPTFAHDVNPGARVLWCHRILGTVTAVHTDLRGWTTLELPYGAPIVTRSTTLIPATEGN